jgi:hypothetical protein
MPYMTEQSGLSREVLFLAHAQHDHNNYTRFLGELEGERTSQTVRRD